METRERSAGGLRDHFSKNTTHHQSTAHDGFQIPSKFDVSEKNPGVYRGPQLHPASVKVVNEMLQKNHTNNHVFFSETGGFHNHEAHHLLAAFALGATPEELQLAHDTMDNAQRPRLPIDPSQINKMATTAGFRAMLGDDRHFHNYIAFFWQRFEKDGWREVLTEYLFSGSEIANDLHVRLFAGIWHNLILVGYGVEFEQPGIIAEGLAGACVHSNVFGPYLRECEEFASVQMSCKPLVTILQEIRDDPTLCDKSHWKGGNSFAYDDDVASNAPAGLASLASQWKVVADLPYRTVELINVNALMAGAAQRPDKAVKIDFIFIHHVNASIFFSAFLQQDWIGEAAKSRLLESYARMTLLFYASSLAPQLRPEEIVRYRPVVPNSTWESIIKRSLVLPDDGHLPKIIRALAHGEQVSQPWEKEDAKRELPVKGDMWLQIANMAIDSAEAEPDIIKRWVRGANSDEAWAEVPNRK